jgi:DNA-binding transcriptional LysR family regulator
MSEIVSQHDQTFRESNLVLRLGATPALRGRFTAAAARLAQQDGRFAKFELVYELTSSALVEQLRMHSINIAIVAESALAMEGAGFAIAHLFEDRIAWAVPAAISEEEIAYALSGSAHPARIDPVLRQYVEIDGGVALRQTSDNWYRANLPWAQPTIAAPPYAASVEFVAYGLGTCHLPLSLLPSLSASVRSQIQVFVIPDMMRSVVLAMRRHFLSHPAFAGMFSSLAEFSQQEYAAEMTEGELKCLPGLAPQLAGAQQGA